MGTYWLNKSVIEYTVPFILVLVVTAVIVYYGVIVYASRDANFRQVEMLSLQGNIIKCIEENGKENVQKCVSEMGDRKAGIRVTGKELLRVIRPEMFSKCVSNKVCIKRYDACAGEILCYERIAAVFNGEDKELLLVEVAG